MESSTFLLYFFLALAVPYVAAVGFLIHGFLRYRSPWNKEKVFSILNNLWILFSVDGLILISGLVPYTLQIANPGGPVQNGSQPSLITIPIYFISAWIPVIVATAILRFYPFIFQVERIYPDVEDKKLTEQEKKELTYRDYERQGRQVLILLMAIGPVAVVLSLLSSMNVLPNSILFSLYIVPVAEFMAIFILLVWIIFLVSNTLNRRKLKKSEK